MNSRCILLMVHHQGMLNFKFICQSKIIKVNITYLAIKRAYRYCIHMLLLKKYKLMNASVKKEVLKGKRYKIYRIKMGGINIFIML